MLDRHRRGCLRLVLWRQSLGVACVYFAVHDRSLDEPVVFTITCDATVDAGWAQIEVARLALAAVVVLIRD